jgi:hypothetical protein
VLQIGAGVFSGAVPVLIGGGGVSLSPPSFYVCYLWGFGVLLLSFVLALMLRFCCEFFQQLSGSGGCVRKLRVLL